MGSLFRGLFTKVTNSFTKTILIEQAELDRLQQRQLRDYSPELQMMGRLLNDIKDIMASKKLSAEKRMNMIFGLHIRFDKLNNETGVLSGALPAQAVSALPLLDQPCCLKFSPKMAFDQTSFWKRMKTSRLRRK